jgi:hypothetical protein
MSNADCIIDAVITAHSVWIRVFCGFQRPSQDHLKRLINIDHLENHPKGIIISTRQDGVLTASISQPFAADLEKLVLLTCQTIVSKLKEIS